MESVQKLALVDPRMLQNLKKQKDPTILSNLDKEMEQILMQNNSDDEKMRLYQQTLQKYLLYKNQIDSTPIQISLQESKPHPQATTLDINRQSENRESKAVSKNEKDKPGTWIEKSVISSLPKALKTKGKILLNSIQHSKEMDYSDSGQLFYKGEPIPDVNLFDVVHDLVRKKSTALFLTYINSQSG